MARFKISVGELIDRLSITNIRVWKSEEAMSKATKDKDLANFALTIRELNRERADLRETINHALEGRGRGSAKIAYPGVGRDA